MKEMRLPYSTNTKLFTIKSRKTDRLSNQNLNSSKKTRTRTGILISYTPWLTSGLATTSWKKWTGSTLRLKLVELRPHYPLLQAALLPSKLSNSLNTYEAAHLKQ